jgi:hypothetical protein
VQGINNFTQVPLTASKYGAGQIVFSPTPNQDYVTEWDCLRQADDLVSASDPDPLPAPWTDPVPFLACHFAKIAIQQFDEADKFKQMYRERMDEVMANARSSQIPYPYFGMPGYIR